MIKYEMIKPSVAVIQVGDDEASNTYIRNKQRACENVGIFFRLFTYIVLGPANKDDFQFLSGIT